MDDRAGRLALVPGSFDPVTLGHLDVIRRAAALWDTVLVAVVRNHSKRALFDAGERADLVRAGLAGLEPTLPEGRVRVEVLGDDVLLAHHARDVHAAVMVKGVRSAADVAYELPMALLNRPLGGVETVFLPGDPAFGHVSSTMVKEVARLGGDVSALVPAAVLGPLLERLGARRATP